MSEISGEALNSNSTMRRPETVEPHREGFFRRMRKRTFRTLLAFWILGLCNNYGYVVMLSAANDIISAQAGDQNSTDNATKISNRGCTYLSTGAILLADILPSLFVKFMAPFLPFFINIRVSICVALASAGFLLVAFSKSLFVSITGVVLTSFCSGLGEATFLQYSSFYDRNAVSAWSSGTGGAGIIGALSYAILQRLGMKTTLLLMLVMPATLGISFWAILPKPSDKGRVNILEIQKIVNREEIKNPIATLKKKLCLIPGLLKYIIPFSLVYLFEYFINQGTFELIRFKNETGDHANYYRWLQVTYQAGVFISRSSVNFFHIRKIWIMTVLQGINVVIFTTEVIYLYIPSFYLVIVLVLWEGVLGGCAYVNTFYRIATEVIPEDKQFSLSITTFGDSIGISLAGILAIFAHNKICDLPLPLH